ncbi:MAG: penicillin-binding protein activator [Spongiibacteraceae bacterium]
MSDSKSFPATKKYGANCALWSERMMSAIARLRNDGTQLRVTTLVLAAVLLAACAGGPQLPGASRTPAKPPAELTLEQISALARDALPAERPRYQLDAVALLIKQGQPEQAQNWLKQVAAPSLDVPQRARYQEMQARLALARNNPQQALAYLQDARLLQTLDQLPQQQQTTLALLKAQALAANRDYLASAQQRVFVDALLQGPQRDQNQKELWRALLSLDTPSLTQARAKATTGLSTLEEWRGWLDLALIYKKFQNNPAALAAGIDKWKQQWRTHPARAQFAPSLSKEIARTTTMAPIEQPGQIALLLPLSGKLAGFGTAVRDGFMAAWYDARAHGTATPAVRIYDTTTTQNFSELYQRAIADGAQAIVGPLEKPQVAGLYQQLLTVPTLALNRADLGTAPPPLLYQFSLAPEDEAEEIARIAGEYNARRALIVAPEEERNARELQAFAARWQQQGGEVVATAVFRNPQMLSQAIKSALNIPQSEARKREIETLFGRKVDFVPHRRDDIDMVLIYARPQQARSIVPTLAYHYAGNIPTYALSRSYNGVDAPGQDADIEGLRFTEIPWLLDNQQPLKQQILNALPQSRGYLRLYALGVDSFHLLPQLRQMENRPDTRLAGQTGYLTLSPERIVQRELMLAQIKDGLARPFGSYANTAPAPFGNDHTDQPGGRESPIDATLAPTETPR